MPELKKVGVKQAVKIGMAIESMTLSEVARATGRAQCTVTAILKRGKPTLSSFSEMLEALQGKLVIRYSNGQEVELEISEK